ncbi:hypothetical protein IRJ41_008330 [Triplophysa rosa]|uniref:Uncharacterized protein n=1 Tax=Triplophysa rosa TaxID=992332 RepID=A0A9W7WBF3_TRIRA|nr:hypothetical protein IRJ41_008330 [Triplophysa rosa]
MFQGNEASLNSVQAHFNSLKALVEREKQTNRDDSHVDTKSSGAELEEEEELILDCDTQLEESVTQIRNSLSLQEVELVELRELVLSYTTSNETIQKLENQLHQLKKEFKASVEELRGEIKGLQQERETINRELKGVREELTLREREIQSLKKQTSIQETPGSPLKNNKESSNPQQKTRFLQTSPHGVFSPNPDKRYFPVRWRLHQQQPMSQNFHPVPLYPHPEQQQPSFRPSHRHHPVPHHRQQHQDLVPPHQPRKKEPLLRKAPRMEQMSAPQPNPHRSERPEQLNYAAALKGQKDTESTNLREIKDMLNLICTRLMDKYSE